MELVNTLFGLISIVWRSLVVGIGYVATLVVCGIAGGALGLMEATGGEDGAVLLGWALCAGFLMGIVLGPLNARMPASWKGHILVWTSAIFLNLSSVAIEGAFFAPELVPIPVPVLLGQQLIAAVVAALLITSLFRPKSGYSEGRPNRPEQPWYSWIIRFVGASASYPIFYALFGIINYKLVTEPYYASHTGGLTVPEPAMVWLVEAIRAPMIVFSIIPFIRIYPARGPGQRIVLSGFLLFWIGGVVPLMFQAMALPAILLITSGIEIFFQNFCTGAIIAFLFWPTRAQAGGKLSN